MAPIDLVSLIDLRHRLHQQPELSGVEYETARTIADFLRPLQPDQLLTEVGGTGVVATFDSGRPGPALLLRCELDALPIREVGQPAYVSRRPGIAHMCGHDGHMAILCGVAQRLAAQRPARGRVHLLFQPAEETGAGAAGVLADSRFTALQPDFAVALHNFPGFPRGAVLVKEGVFTAAVESLVFQFQGRTSHASEPENGLNPAAAVAELLAALPGLTTPDPINPDFALITTVYVRVGQPESYGVSAGDGEVHLTIRCWDDARLRALEEKIRALAEKGAARHSLTLRWQRTQTFAANSNASAAIADVRRAAEAGGLPVQVIKAPFKGGEDFGLISSRYSGCLFGLGSGEDVSALHNPDYDFPDELIGPAIELFGHLIAQRLG